MKIETGLMKRLHLAHPIIQAPLAGGGDAPQLVAAVCEAGALGFIGAAYLTPAQVADTGRAVRSLTTRPFGINLFAPSSPPRIPSDAMKAVKWVTPYFTELGLSPPSILEVTGSLFLEQLTATIQTGASVFSFTLGILPPDAIAEVKHHKMFLIGTATTVSEAITLEKSGVDAVVVQGSEAGGHRATFATEFDSGMIGTMALVPQIVDAVRIPIITSGGIMDGRGIVAALVLGAGAVQMGTAFLTCHEAGVPPAYKRAILTATEDQTRVTRTFSGRQARGISNRFMREVESDGGGESILPFPLQNTLTRPLRTAAAKQGRAEFLSLWAGQGVRMACSQSAAELVNRLANETQMIMDNICGENQRTT